MHKNHKTYQETDISKADNISGECKTESPRKGEERNNQAAKSEKNESAHNTQKLQSIAVTVDWEIQEDLQAERNNYQEGE